MASSADICNLALLKLGSGSKITSLTDSSTAASALRIAYDLCRKAELRANTWSFALKRDSLAELATPPAWGFAHAYQLPADFLRLTQVNQFYVTPALIDYASEDTSAYAIDNGQIQTDYTAPLNIRYVRDITDEGLFDALFTVAFACRLALETCEQITNSTSKKQSIKQDYIENMKAAVRANSIEKPPALVGDDSWVISRL